MRERLAEIAENIRQLEADRRVLAESLRGTSEASFQDALEKNLIHIVSPLQFSGSVCAVDGGLLAQEYQGFDLVLSRAVGVLFSYSDGKLSSHKYHPNALPQVDTDTLFSLEAHEFNLHKSLFRLKKEVECSISCVKKWTPDFLFVDGSLVPQISDKPSEDNPLHDYYCEVVSLHKQLYSACEENNCSIVGVIKDSRGKRFIELVSKIVGANSVLDRSSDTSFLNFLLKQGERSFAFRYSRSPREHQVLKDFGEVGEKLCVCYLKPAAEDQPVRIEFFSNAEVGKVASVVQSLSSINKKYAYPAVLIEADLRAALEPMELERAYRELSMHTGLSPSSLKLRRNNRPFR